MKNLNTIGGDFPVHIYNSLSGRKELLRSIVPEKISLYVCGMTVYDYCHIGHARVLVVFDVFVRYLRSLGVEVDYVRNITDVDDKIIARAQELGLKEEKITERFIRAMHEDEKVLNVIRPDAEPRATMYMEQIIELIEKLVDLGYAYQGEQGDVYFRIRKFKDYGHLSKRTLDQIFSGSRIEINEDKDDPLDFVLWKTYKKDEPFWESPWGPGRPGWHIECSAMSMSCLGEQFDIHAGGMDLKFPHHENEIAQSEASTGRKFVNYWMHNGYVQNDEEKMSKSLGNFFSIREILNRDFSQARMGEVIRFMMLTSHYRSPLNFSPKAIENARVALIRLYRVLDKIEIYEEKNRFDTKTGQNWSSFHTAMSDDLNTPEALSVLFNMAKKANRLWDDGKEADARAMTQQLAVSANILGLLYQNPQHFLQGLNERGQLGSNKNDQMEIERLIEERLKARSAGDWNKADQIRESLRKQGILLEDNSDGTTNWRAS